MMATHTLPHASSHIRAGVIQPAHAHRRAYQSAPTSGGHRIWQRQSPAAASAAATEAAAAGEPARSFWPVVFPTGCTLLLCNMDRICMSVAILPMAKVFGWSPSVQGIVQVAFLCGYMVTQLLGGALADKLGGKAVISDAIKMFSAASLILPIVLDWVPPAQTLAAVVLARFLGVAP